MKQLKCVLTLAGISVAAFSLAACQIVASPMAGTISTRRSTVTSRRMKALRPKRGKPAVRRFWGGLLQVMPV